MKKAILRTLVICIPLFVIFIGPWPIDETHYSHTQYAKNTLDRIDATQTDNRSAQLFAGTAKIEITPPPGVPLGGYSARNPKANTGIMAPVFARAVTISNEYKQITLLSAEILLPLPELVDAVLKQTGSNRNDIYFAASHTHSGPGAYDSTIIGQQALGNYSQNQFKILTQQLSKAILQSRKNQQPVSLHYQRFNIKEKYQKTYIYNQLTKGPNPHDSIHILQLRNRQNQKNLGTLISFSAHPTFLGRVNKKVSGDYPALIMNQLESQSKSLVMFMSGAVGGMLAVGDNRKPASEIEIQISQMRDFGTRLTSQISKALKTDNYAELEIEKSAEWRSQASSIQSRIISVDLPFSNYRISDTWRISPLLVENVFHERKTFIQQLKIGKLVFLAYPADYSGILAQKLELWAANKNIYPWATTFNGDYIGYAMPSEFNDKKISVMRSANFFGPWVGDYFFQISKNLIMKSSENISK